MSVQIPESAIDIQDFRFKLLGQVRVFEKEDHFQTNSLNLITTASEYGLIFVAVNGGFQVIQTAHFFVQEPQLNTHEFKSLPRRIIKIGANPTHIEVNYLQNYLAVVIHKDGCPNALIYDIPSFFSQNVNLLNQIRLSPTHGSFVYDISWNPGTGTSLAVCTSDGSVSLFDFNQNGINIQNLPPTTGARCLSWSPKGKQLVVGTMNGSLTQYKPDLKPAKSIPGPTDGQYSIYSILWISNFQFATIMKDNLKAEERPGLFIVNAPKNGPITFINYGDICYGSGDLRIPQFYLMHITSWSILVVASANSIDVGLLGLDNDGLTWQQWNPDDSAWASLPLDANKRDTFCVGMSLDISPQKPIQWGDNQVLAPAPLLTLLSHDGVLCLYQAINLKPQSASLCKPSKIASDQSGLNQFIPMDISASSAPVATVPVSPAPAISATISQSSPLITSSFKEIQPTSNFISETPQTSTPSLFGGSNLFGGAGAGFSLGGISTVSSSTPTTTNITATGSNSTQGFGSFTGFESQSTSKPGTLFGSSSLFNSGPAPTTTPSLFSQPTILSSLLAQPTTTSSISVTSTPMSNTTSTTANISTGISQTFVSQTPTIMAGIGFGSTTFPSLSTTQSSLLPTPTPFPTTQSSLLPTSTPFPTTQTSLLPTPTPFPTTQSSLLPTSTSFPTTTSTISLNFSTPSTISFAQLTKPPPTITKTTTISNPTNTSLNTTFTNLATPTLSRTDKFELTSTSTTTPFQIAPSSNLQTGSIMTGKPTAIGTSTLIKETEKTIPVSTASIQQPLSTIKQKNNIEEVPQTKNEPEVEPVGLSTAVFAASVLDDMQYFETELSELKTRVESLDLNSIHSGSDSLQTRLASLDAFVNELQETTTAQHNEVDALKTELLETFSWHEDAISKMDYFKNPTITQLLDLQATDPAAARRLSSIQNLAFHIENQIIQLNTVMDDAWAKKHLAKISSLKDKNKQLYIPINEEILQTLILHTKILQTRKTQMLKILERCRLPVDLKKSNVSDIINSESDASELTRKLKAMGLTPESSTTTSSLTSASGNSRKMQAYIRKLLRPRRVVTIRPSRPIYVIEPSEPSIKPEDAKEKIVMSNKSTTEFPLQESSDNNISIFNNINQGVVKTNVIPTQNKSAPMALNFNRQPVSLPEVTFNYSNKPVTSTVAQVPAPLPTFIKPTNDTPKTPAGSETTSSIFTQLKETGSGSVLMKALSGDNTLALAKNKIENKLFQGASATTTKSETVFSFTKPAESPIDMFKPKTTQATPPISFNSSSNLNTNLTNAIGTQNTFTFLFPTTPSSVFNTTFDNLNVPSTSTGSTTSSFGTKPLLESTHSIFGGTGINERTNEGTFSFGRLLKSESVSNLETVIDKEQEVEEVQNPEVEDDDDQESIESQPSVIKVGEEAEAVSLLTFKEDTKTVHTVPEIPKNEDNIIAPEIISINSSSIPTNTTANSIITPITTISAPTSTVVATNTVVTTQSSLSQGLNLSKSLFATPATSFSFGKFPTPALSTEVATTTNANATIIQPATAIVTTASEIPLITTSTTLTSLTSTLSLPTLNTPNVIQTEISAPAITTTVAISSVASLTTSLVTSATPLVTSASPLVTSATPLVTSATPLVTSATPLVTSATPLVTSATPVIAATTKETTPSSLSFGQVTKPATADSATSALSTFSFNSFGFGTTSPTATTTQSPAVTTISSNFAFATPSTTNAGIFGSSPSGFGGTTSESTSLFASKPSFGSPTTSTTAASVFGGSTSPQGSIFGGSGFGSNNNTTQSSAVSGSSNSGFMFGGQTSFTSNAFGNTNAVTQPPATAPSTIFGTPVSSASSFSGGLFKQSSFSQPAFGGKPAFGQPSMFNQSSTFGTSNSGSIFGNSAPAASSNSVFGGMQFQSSSNAQGGPFSSAPDQSVALTGFGSPPPTNFGSPQPGGFGGSPVFRPTFGGTPSFGAPSQPTNLFASPSNQGGTIFGGGQQQGSSTFESLASSQSTMTFGNLAQQASPTQTFGSPGTAPSTQNTGASGMFGGQGNPVFSSGGTSSSFGGRSFSSWR